MLGFARHDDALAERRLDEALRLFKDIGARGNVAEVMLDQSLLARRRGLMTQSDDLCRSVLPVCFELANWPGATIALLGLAVGAFARGDQERASRLLAAVHVARQRIGTGAWPDYRAEYEQLMSQLAVDRAPAMPLEEAMAYALAEPSPPVATEPPSAAPAAPQPAASPLTRRELEVAGLVAQGLTNREVAQVLVISERTADAHVGKILEKLGIRGRAQIGAWVAARANAQPK
jgi:non-specific serine/threonine protein kinase